MYAPRGKNYTRLDGCFLEGDSRGIESNYSESQLKITSNDVFITVH